MNKIEFGDCREIMRNWAADGVKVQTCVTSPPYFGLRDYGHEGQIGLEQTPDEYIAAIVEVFRCVRDLLSDDGTLWLNLGDSYGSGKQLLGIPWRVALALQADGWILRQDIIWNKPNPMPESVRDRCTKAHEYIFLLSKSEKYFFDSEAIREESADPIGSAARYKSSFGGKKNETLLATNQVHTRPIGMREFDGKRNRRSVWTVTTRPYKGAHFATFPPALIEPCILAGSRLNDIVLDPFMGSGTTAQVAMQNGRQYLGCELNQEYEYLQNERIGLI
jgi:DNA modification methylase